jgi:hypothetical protein
LDARGSPVPSPQCIPVRTAGFRRHPPVLALGLTLAPGHRRGAQVSLRALRAERMKLPQWSLLLGVLLITMVLTASSLARLWLSSATIYLSVGFVLGPN